MGGAESCVCPCLRIIGSCIYTFAAINKPCLLVGKDLRLPSNLEVELQHENELLYPVRRREAGTHHLTGQNKWCASLGRL